MSDEQVRVVLVDDNPLMSELASLYLRGSFSVQQAEDVASALPTIKETQPHIVVLDYLTPEGLSISEAIQRVRDASPTSRVLIFTAFDESQVRAQAQAADAILPKDRVKELPEVVDQLLETN